MNTNLNRNRSNRRGSRGWKRGWKRLLSCLFGCFNKQGSDSGNGIEEVDISTPYQANKFDSFISDPSTDDGQVPRFRAAKEYFYGNRNIRSEDSERDITQPATTPIDDQKPTPTNVAFSESQDGVELDINGVEVSEDDETDWVDARSFHSVEEENEGSSCLLGAKLAPSCMELVPFHDQVDLHDQSPERISRDSDEVKELEKVLTWQRGRAVLGRNNLLRHRCDVGGPRRRGIFDFYNQDNALIGDVNDMTNIVFSGP